MTTQIVDRVDFIQQKIGSVKRTDEGFLQGTAPVAKVGILTYVLKDGSIRRELVTEDTLFERGSMDSLKLKPVTNQHPKETLLDSKTVKKRKIGMTGENIKRDGTFLVSSLVITDSDAIKDIENGTNELSPGYRATVLIESGEWEGQKYDAIQLKRKYNHLAACDCARGGHDLRLNLDSMGDIKHIDGFEIDENTINKDNGNSTSKKEKKNMPKITHNGIEYDAAQEIINLVNKMCKDAAKFDTKIDDLNTKHDKLSGEYDTLKADHKKLQDSIPELVLQGVAEKTTLDNACQNLFSEDEVKNLDGKSNEDIKKALIVKKYPEAKLDGKSNVYVDARFDALLESVENDKKDNKAINNQRKIAKQSNFNNDSNSNSDIIDGDKAYYNMVKRDENAWRENPNKVIKK